MAERIGELVALGLGQLSLDRAANTLSTGELQRVRLASVLRSGLAGVTLVLDEPAAGLHERDVEALLARLRNFQADGNTVVLVSHRPSVLRAADHLIELGPGAGREGGELIASGTPAELLAGDSPTAKALARASRSQVRELAPDRIQIRGARANNLDGFDCELPVEGFVCVTGTSGSGKTSLTFDVLGASIRTRRAVECETLEVPGGFERFVDVHDGRSTNSNGLVLSAINLASEIAALFSDSSLPVRAFKPGDSAGRCPACRGTGRERVALDFIADLDLACQACSGKRFTREVLSNLWRGRSVADVLETPASELLRELELVEKANRTKSHAKLCGGLQALSDVAIGHVALGRSRGELSGGESTRVALAASLLHADSPALYLFDEPSTGLHEADLKRVIRAFRKLGARGDLVVATEHRESVIAAADWVIEI